MKNLIKILLTAFIASCMSFCYAATESDPVALLKGIADEMIQNLKTHKATLKTNPDYVYSLSNKLVVPHADLDYMSKMVLPPQTWNAATEAQRKSFEKEFTTVLERTYASALADYSDETVNFFPVRGGVDGQSSVTVNSKIDRSDGPSVNVSYRLIRVGSNWKLYDMNVEGISMLESFRSQFGDILAQGDMNELLKKLRDHNNK